MNYWIFKTNPDRYRIDQRLKDPEPATTWIVSRYKDEIRAGDLAFIWRAGNPRGICAILQITSDPKEITEELAHERPYHVGSIKEPFMGVMGVFTNSFPIIASNFLKAVSGLEGLSVFHGFQMTTNFKVTAAEGAIILKLFG